MLDDYSGSETFLINSIISLLAVVQVNLPKTESNMLVTFSLEGYSPLRSEREVYTFNTKGKSCFLS